MPDGGKLTIETSNASLDEDYAAHNAGVQPGQFVLIAISDTGVGMPAEVIEHAFEPFYTTKGVQGTGLGLALTKRFIELHGGQIRIASEPGMGSVFTLVLPLTPTGANPRFLPLAS